MTKKISFLFVVSVILFVGIVKINNEYYNNDIPEILFLKQVNYENENLIAFYDKNGNYYSTDDKYVCSLSISDLIKEYSEGNLKNKIKFVLSCDKNILLFNYNKLKKLSFEKIEILYPNECPQVEVPIYDWYYLYYDTKNQIKKVCIHRNDRCGDLNTNYVEVNEVYEWWSNSLERK